MSELALQLIAENKRTKETFLDLGNCDLKELPDEIQELVHLEGLNLCSYYKYKNDATIASNNTHTTNELSKIDKIKKLIKLKYLYLGGSCIEDITPLKYLINIRFLDLANAQVGDIGFLKYLPNIQELNLSFNHIKDFTPIENSTSIRKLDLSYARVENIEFIKHLPNIKELNLDNSSINDIKPLKNATSIHSLSLINTFINSIAPLKYLTDIQKLFLSYTPIKDLEPLKYLSNLKTLYLSDIKIKDFEFLKDLKKIQKLDLSYTLINNLEPLKTLKNIQELRLYDTPIKDLEPLKNLKKIQELDLSYTLIKDFKLLQYLPNIKALYLSDIKIHNLEFLKNLKKIQKLNLSKTIIKDLDSIKHLSNIQELDLSYTPINNLEPLRSLSNIQRLILSETIIKDLDPIKHLSNIQELDLSYTPINNLEPLRSLSNIQRLILSGTLIKDLDPIKYLSNIQELDLSYSLINNLEPLLKHIKRGLEVSIESYSRDITVHNTPLQYPPIEVVKEGNEAILNYFEEIKNQGTDYIYEAKLLIVGKGGAGKTSLAIKLEDDTADLPQEKDTTRGIDIKQITFPCKEDNTFTINIWDFGGQEIYHSTHQFFLTKKSLYVLLDDTRESDKTVNDGSFKYWLEVVRLFGGGSPLLIVQNEKGNRSKDIDLQGMQAQFDFIKDKLATNLEDNRGLEEVKSVIEHHIQRLPHIGDALPKKWSIIRKKLLVVQKEKAHITLQEYLDICTQNGIEDRTKALHLGDYLHNLGNLLHFQDNPILKRLVILQNKWATDAVYRVLDNETIKTAKGYFSYNQLSSIWSEDIYQDHLPELLALMLKFELCYELEIKDNYLIPQLLPESRPKDFTWSYENNLQLRYEYQFMPKGILSRFIVRMNAYVKDRSKSWKNGVVLDRNNTYAFVNEVYGQNELKVHVYGEEPRDFIILIAEEVEKLNRQFEGIICTKEVPCICEECKWSKEPSFYAFNDVLKARRAKNGEIQCRKSFEMISAMHLIDNISSLYDRRSEGIGEEPVYDKPEREIHIHNHVHPPTTTEDKPEPVESVPSPLVENVIEPAKKFYQKWWFANIVASVGVGLFIALCAFEFKYSSPFRGFLLGFGVSVVLLFLKGNPERRFFKAGMTSLAAALSVFALQIGFSYSKTSNTPGGVSKILVEWMSSYDWLISLALIILSAGLFVLDYLRDRK